VINAGPERQRARRLWRSDNAQEVEAFGFAYEGGRSRDQWHPLNSVRASEIRHLQESDRRVIQGYPKRRCLTWVQLRRWAAHGLLPLYS
jgi:hypothetical protein